MPAAIRNIQDTWRYAGNAARIVIVAIVTLLAAISGIFISKGMFGSFFVLFFVLFIIEISVFILVHYISARFNSILAIDRIPKLKRSMIDKFWDHGFDPELGWNRKPDTAKTDWGVPYRIDHRGSRENPGHGHLETLVSTYGDSYTFCREVKDDQTWQWHLAETLQKNVLNFGVGNYGLDQALIRLKREYDSNPTPVVIMGIVPDTIARNLSVWKHYNEFGNVLAFKPRFEIRNDRLILVPNIMTSKDRFLSLEKYISKINEADYFYKNKFKPGAFRFPFSLSATLNYKPIVLFFTKILRTLLKKFNPSSEELFNELIVNRLNGAMVKQAEKLYQDPYACGILEKIVDEFIDFSQQKGFLPILLIMPMKEDIWYIKKYRHYYREFFEGLKTKITIIDAMDSFSKCNQYNNYFEQWHYSNEGNRLIAQAVNQCLDQIQILSKKGSYGKNSSSTTG